MTKQEAYERTTMIAEMAVEGINVIAKESGYEAKGMLKVLIKVLETGLKDD